MTTKQMIFGNFQLRVRLPAVWGRVGNNIVLNRQIKNVARVKSNLATNFVYTKNRLPVVWGGQQYRKQIDR